MIHEYLHTLTHEHYYAYARTLPGGDAGVQYNTLIEGMTSAMTEIVWANVAARVGQRALSERVEGTSLYVDEDDLEGRVPGDPGPLPLLSPGDGADHDRRPAERVRRLPARRGRHDQGVAGGHAVSGASDAIARLRDGDLTAWTACRRGRSRPTSSRRSTRPAMRPRWPGSGCAGRSCASASWRGPTSTRRSGCRPSRPRCGSWRSTTRRSPAPPSRSWQQLGEPALRLDNALGTVAAAGERVGVPRSRPHGVRRRGGRAGLAGGAVHAGPAGGVRGALPRVPRPAPPLAAHVEHDLARRAAVVDG